MSEWTEWQKQIGYTFAAGIGFALEGNIRKQLVKRGLTASGIGLAAVGTRLAIEGVGLASSAAIGGKQGMKDWQVASAKMFHWGPASHVPVVGQALSLIPNPIAVGSILFESGRKIGTHYGPRDLVPSVRKPSTYSRVPDDDYGYSAPGHLL